VLTPDHERASTRLKAVRIDMSGKPSAFSTGPGNCALRLVRQAKRFRTDSTPVSERNSLSNIFFGALFVRSDSRKLTHARGNLDRARPSRFRPVERESFKSFSVGSRGKTSSPSRDWPPSRLLVFLLGTTFPSASTHFIVIRTSKSFADQPVSARGAGGAESRALALSAGRGSEK
jgi:hypothetical protein